MFIPVVFCGGQYNHLIVRALRELGVESRLVPMNTIKLEDVEAMEVDGLVMRGPQRWRWIEAVWRSA